MTRLIGLSCNTTTTNGTSYLDKVLFDSGANCCITNNSEDFIGEIETYVPNNNIIDGIGKGLKVEGVGTVSWTFQSACGHYRTLELQCYYVPSTNQRIASLQCILDNNPKENFSLDSNALVLSGYDEVPSLTIPLCPDTNLPVAALAEAPLVVSKRAKRGTEPHEQLPTTVQPSLTAASNLILTDPEKELLRWHHRLGHIGMKRVQWLFCQGILSMSKATRKLHSSASKLTQGPRCTEGRQYADWCLGHSSIEVPKYGNVHKPTGMSKRQCQLLQPLDLYQSHQ